MKIKINETLQELMYGIFVWGVFWQAAGIWFVPDKLGCSLGLWLGIITAEVCALHMYKSLDKALDLSEKDAQKYTVSRSLMRYGLIIIVLLVMMLIKAVNPLSGFLGVIGLKAAAYMQPFMHKFLGKLRK